EACLLRAFAPPDYVTRVLIVDSWRANRRSEEDHASWPFEARPRVRTQWRLSLSAGRRNYLTWEFPEAVSRSGTHSWALDPRRRGGAREYPKPGFGRR